MNSSAMAPAEALLATSAAGETGREIAGRDWASSSLGPAEHWPPALVTALSLILPARTPMALFWGADFLAFYNDAWLPMIGDRHPHALGRPARDIWSGPWGDLESMLVDARDSGATRSEKDRLFRVERDGIVEAAYFNVSCSVVREGDGTVGGVLCVVCETTDQVRARTDIADDRDRLAQMFEQAPGFMAVLAGPDHVYELTNIAHDSLIGGRPAIGRPLRDVLPEMQEQGILDLLDEVYRTGEPYIRRGVSLMLPVAGGAQLEERVLDVVCQPIRDAQGRTTRLFIEGNDVTDRVRAVEAQRSSEERLRLATQAARIGTWDYNILEDRHCWDEQCKALFGFPSDQEITAALVDAAIHPEDRDIVQAAAARALDPAGDGKYVVTHRIIHARTGEARWIFVSGGTVLEEGRPVRFIGATQDITARKQAEEALAASEEALREETRALEVLNRTAARFAAELDHDRLIQTVVDAGVELIDARFGAFFYNVSDAIGDSFTLFAVAGAEREAFAHFPMPRVTELFAPTFAGDGVIRSDDITRDPRYGQNHPFAGMPVGHMPVASYLALPVRARSGHVLGALLFGHEARGVFSERDERLMGGLVAQAAIAIDNARLFRAVRRANQDLEEQVSARTAERDRIWQVSQDLLGVTDGAGVMLLVNPAWTRLLGWEADEIIGRTADWLQHPDDRAVTRREIARMADGVPSVEFDTRLRARDGSYRTIEWRAVSAEDRSYCVGRDVTEERAQAEVLSRTEEQLRQSQKMDTVGQLTGGIAHDFNNLLQIVIGNIETIQRSLPEEAERLRRAAGNAMTGANRAAVLTQRLLAFSRRQPLAPRSLDANKLISGMSEMLHRALGETIRIETKLAPALWLTEVDPIQLEMAILNLGVNARDAMPQGGRLSIETANTHLDRDYVAQQAEVAPGQYVAISVSDTGVGMNQQVLSRVFEPFFTTKDVGKGTGLGLSMVYGFVKQSGGHVKIQSELGHGTTVHIYLPRRPGTGAEDEEKAPGIPSGGKPGETILLCEDDGDVRAYMVDLLQELGYAVLSVADGPAALSLLEQDGPVDLLFTDVVLPAGMSGAALAERARAIRPGLKVLFTTGYAREALAHHGRLGPGMDLIAKPFGYADLAQRLRDMLDS